MLVRGQLVPTQDVKHMMFLLREIRGRGEGKCVVQPDLVRHLGGAIAIELHRWWLENGTPTIAMLQIVGQRFVREGVLENVLQLHGVSLAGRLPSAGARRALHACGCGAANGRLGAQWTLVGRWTGAGPPSDERWSVQRCSLVRYRAPCTGSSAQLPSAGLAAIGRRSGAADGCQTGGRRARGRRE